TRTTSHSSIPLHDALPICRSARRHDRAAGGRGRPSEPDVVGDGGRGERKAQGFALPLRTRRREGAVERMRSIARDDEGRGAVVLDRKSTRLNSSHVKISYA